MNHSLFLEMFSGTDWVIILLVVLVLFGGRKIPELMRGLGQGMREFNDAKNNVKNEIQNGMNSANQPPPPPPPQQNDPQK